MRRRVREQAPLEAGNTLLEVMLGLGILVTVMSAALTSAQTALNLNHHITQIARATVIAEQVTEELLLMDGSDARLEVGSHEATYDREGERDPDGAFTATWKVDSYEKTPGIRRLLVEVQWMEQERMRTVSWETYRN